MVLMVEKPSEETQPILGSDGATGRREPDLKIDACMKKDACKHIIKSMRADPLKIEKPELVLELFSTAVKMQNVSLANECIDILNENLNKTNAVLILRQLDQYRVHHWIPTRYDPHDLAPSAPPILENDSQFHEDWVQDLIHNLRNNCLLEIDKNADYVLKQKEILELSYDDVVAITSRDTLLVSNETLVFSVVVRWTVEECKRLDLDLTVINLKAVLRKLVHAPRYGLMSKREFCCATIDGVKGPRHSGLLEAKEVAEILNFIKKKTKNRPVANLLYKGSRPRSASNVFHCGTSGDRVCSVTTSCDKLVINFLTCWTVIFD